MVTVQWPIGCWLWLRKRPASSASNPLETKSALPYPNWRDLDSIKNWKRNVEHIEAQRLGKKRWYATYQVRIAKVEQNYAFDRTD